MQQNKLRDSEPGDEQHDDEEKSIMENQSQTPSSDSHPIIDLHEFLNSSDGEGTEDCHSGTSPRRQIKNKCYSRSFSTNANQNIERVHTENDEETKKLKRRMNGSSLITPSHGSLGSMAGTNRYLISYDDEFAEQQTERQSPRRLCKAISIIINSKTKRIGNAWIE